MSVFAAVDTAVIFFQVREWWSLLFVSVLEHYFKSEAILEGCLDIAFPSCFQTQAGISFTALSNLCCPRASVLRNSGFCFIIRQTMGVQLAKRRLPFLVACLNHGSRVKVRFY